MPRRPGEAEGGQQQQQRQAGDPERGQPQGVGWGPPSGPGGTQASEWGGEGGPRGRGAAQGAPRLELRDVAVQVSWGAGGGGPERGGTQASEAPPPGWPQEGLRAERGAGCGPGGPPGSGGALGLGWEGGAPRRGSPRPRVRCQSCVALSGQGGGLPREVGSRRSCSVELGAGEPRGGQAGRVRHSRSGDVSGARRDPVAGPAVWARKEWGRPPVEASGQVWVPRKPARAPGRTGLPWSQGGAPPQRGPRERGTETHGAVGPPPLGQVWVPREKPAPAGGGPADVWVHKVRDPSGAGIMWVWAKVTNCDAEEEAEESRVWTFRKGGSRKDGRGEGGYGVS